MYKKNILLVLFLITSCLPLASVEQETQTPLQKAAYIENENFMQTQIIDPLNHYILPSLKKVCVTTLKATGYITLGLLVIGLIKKTKNGNLLCEKIPGVKDIFPSQRLENYILEQENIFANSWNDALQDIMQSGDEQEHRLQILVDPIIERNQILTQQNRAYAVELRKSRRKLTCN